MKKIALTALLLGLSLSTTINAREIAGENIPETLSIKAVTPLKLNGAGVRSKFFMDLYIGGSICLLRRLPQPRYWSSHRQQSA